MLKVFSSFSKTLIWDRSSLKFAIGVWLGLSFSIGVILSTIGLMDGFVSSMRQGLRQSSGDVFFYSRSGFFKLNERNEQLIRELGVTEMTGIIESQAFIVAGASSKGISVKGVDGKEFSKLTTKEIYPEPGKVIIGDELAKVLRLSIGDDIVLVLAKGNKEMDGLPLLNRFKVQGIIDHGIHQKDLRLVYVDIHDLSKLLDVSDRVNVYALNLPKLSEGEPLKRPEKINNLRYNLEEILGIDFRVKPYWYDYHSLLEAVQIEKVTIGIILQIIVVISIFNVLSFVTYLNEKRSREIFLFQALGMSAAKLRKSWMLLVFNLWVASCLFSVFFVYLFDYLLGNLSILNLPGDVYYLGRLKLNLDIWDYGVVFTSALAWLVLIVAIALYRMNKSSILSGLRKEFS